MRLSPVLALAATVTLSACPNTNTDTAPAGLGDGGSVTVNPPEADSAKPFQLFVGAWTVDAADVDAAGFATLTINADGTYAQTGRSDGEPASGEWSRPTSIPVDPSYGNPPAGIAGPYLQLDNSSEEGDGEWDYGSAVEADDASTLILTLYAQRYGMGLRWATDVVTIHLSATP